MAQNSVFRVVFGERRGRSAWGSPQGFTPRMSALARGRHLIKCWPEFDANAFVRRRHFFGVTLSKWNHQPNLPKSTPNSSGTEPIARSAWRPGAHSTTRRRARRSRDRARHVRTATSRWPRHTSSVTSSANTQTRAPNPQIKKICVNRLRPTTSWGERFFLVCLESKREHDDPSPIFPNFASGPQGPRVSPTIPRHSAVAPRGCGGPRSDVV